MSLASIIFGGVFIEGFVNKQLQDQDIVADLNVTTSFTIFVDVVFFILVQKSLELHLPLIQVFRRYKHRIEAIFFAM